MSKGHKQAIRRFRLALYMCILVGLLIIALVGIHYWEYRHSAFGANDTIGAPQTTLLYNDTEYTLNTAVETTLLLGLDCFESTVDYTSYNNDMQSDFLLLLATDNAKKTTAAIQINRDTMAQMDVLGVAGSKIGTVTQQLALAYTYGSGAKDSCRNAARAVSGLFHNIEINHYLSTTMNAVVLLNDSVGGVTVTIEDDFSATDETLKQGETVTLLGEHALNYVRARSSMEDGTNVARMNRQRRYLNALFDAVSSRIETDADFVVDTTARVSEHIISDCTVNQLEKLMNTLSEYEFLGIFTVDGTSVPGEQYMEFYPDEDALLKLVIEHFYVPVG